MIFGKTKLELKVGVFVFIGLTILIIFLLSIGGIKTWSTGYRVNFVFHFVNGTKIGAPVRFAGVDAGQVKDLIFKQNPSAKTTEVWVSCWLKKDIKIPVDSNVWVETLGLLGEKYIEVIPGTDYVNVLAPGGSLVGQEPIPMHQVTDSALNIADNLNDMLSKIKNKEGSLGKLIYDDAFYNELTNKEGNIGKLFSDDKLYRSMDELIQDIKKHPWKLFWKTKDKR